MAPWKDVAIRNHSTSIEIAPRNPTGFGPGLPSDISPFFPKAIKMLVD